MPGANRVVLSLCLLWLAGCNTDKSVDRVPNQGGEVLAYKPEDRTSLQTASCPDPDQFVMPQSIPLTATPLSLKGLEGADLNGLTFYGGWHLTSEEPNFGGLSGLAVHPKDHLLAVSDAGAFVWIAMRAGVPSGFAAISYMKGETGKHLDGKRQADSEGLALRDGLAFVSFEHNHRLLAFDLARCGAAAKGIPMAQIPVHPDGLGRAIPDNEGAEALFLGPEGELIAGLEVKDGKGAPLLQLSPGPPRLKAYLPRPADKRLVGLDTYKDTIFALYRSYAPLIGNANEIYAFERGSSTPHPLADLRRPFPVDNFEGITTMRLPDGTRRIYIISDDNFSERQRTLLLAFDLMWPTDVTD